MASKMQNYNRKVSSFSPSWCLRPPSAKYSSPSSSSSSSSSKKKGASPSPKLAAEPSSPRVGCMGQVRRRKVSPSATPGSVSSSSSGGSPWNYTRQFSLLMIKRVISSKILLREMDPPRPVEKKAAGADNSVGLWKRRCSGGDVLRLQLQQPAGHVCA